MSYWIAAAPNMVTSPLFKDISSLLVDVYLKTYIFKFAINWNSIEGQFYILRHEIRQERHPCHISNMWTRDKFIFSSLALFDSTLLLNANHFILDS